MRLDTLGLNWNRLGVYLAALGLDLGADGLCGCFLAVDRSTVRVDRNTVGVDLNALGLYWHRLAVDLFVLITILWE